jgi:glutaredoxin
MRRGRVTGIAVIGLLALATLVVAPACTRKRDDGTAPGIDKPLPELSLKDETPDLLLTWIDDKGDTHVELRPQDVPAPGRGFVRVVVSDRDDGTRDLFYVADLGQRHEDGTYAVQTVKRSAWEAEIDKRRVAYFEKTAPPRPAPVGPGVPGAPAMPGASPRPGQDTGAATVIIYGASWCGPCHQAADYLKSKGVPYVLKDIEQVPGAAAEMQQKLAKVGRRGGSIPVIDVRGQIIVGFSPSAVDGALARSAAGTTL